MADVKLQALEASDLAILSAHCQDGVVRAGDMAYTRRRRQFALVCNRFDWAGAVASGNKPPFQRHRAGLRFEAVNRVQVAGFDPRAVDHILVLLAISFTPAVEPAGMITLQFAAGAAIRLDVDYIEAELKDLGAVWTTDQLPDHAGAPPAPTGDAADRQE